jgi:D-alanyl-D-alanine carboxypeptidase
MILRKHFSILIMFLLMGLPSGCTTSPADLSELREELNLLVSASTQDENSEPYRNAVVLLDSPRHSFTYRGASGIGSVQPRTAMTPDHQFYIESITKTFTATVVLQLAEEGRLGEKGLEANLGELEIFPPEVLDQLHRIEGESYGSSITVSQLVHHRTGMKNFTYDDENGRVADYPDQSFAPNSLLGLFVGDPEKGVAGLLKCAVENIPEGTNPITYIGDQGFPGECNLSSYYFFAPPYKHWDYSAWKKDPKDRLAGLLNYYLSGMNQTAMFPPGDDFAYTDTNYLVLGLLIEKITGNSLHSELRQRIFEPLRMERTYMSYATDPLADNYRRDLSELWALDLPIVQLGINRSMMWSDAGIVSTVDDLNTFIRALAAGKLFKDESTLETMISLPAGVEMGYGCGIVVDRTGDDTILFHSGGAASWMIYFTQADVSFIGTMNDATAGGSQRFGEVHKGFQEALGKHGIKINSPF